MRNEIFIANLKALRHAFHLTQEKMAAAAGVKRNLYGAWEEGRAKPRHEVLAVLCETFKIDDMAAFISKPHLFTNTGINIPRHKITEFEKRYRKLSPKNRKIVDLILESNP